MQKSPQNGASRPTENASKISRRRQNFPFVRKAFNLIKDPVASHADVLLAPQKSSLMNHDWGVGMCDKPQRIKTESTRKLSNFNFQWTKTLYQNNLKHIAFFFTFFKG